MPRNSVARACLQAALDETGQPRKNFAVDIAVSEPELSRALAGTTATRFDIGWLDALPPSVACVWLQKYAEQKFGARVVLPEPSELLAHVLAQVEQLTRQVGAIQIARELRTRKGAA